MIKPLKLGLRIWLAFTAAVSFLTGWAMLAHSGKPAPLSASASLSGSSSTAPLSLPTLAPVPSLNDFTSGQPLQQQSLQPLSIQSMPSLSSALPGLRTRGS
jgi:hypothetical protein